MDNNKWFDLDEKEIKKRVEERFTKWRDAQRDPGHSGPQNWLRRKEIKWNSLKKEVVREMNEDWALTLLLGKKNVPPCEGKVYHFLGALTARPRGDKSSWNLDLDLRWERRNAMVALKFTVLNPGQFPYYEWMRALEGELGLTLKGKNSGLNTMHISHKTIEFSAASPTSYVTVPLKMFSGQLQETLENAKREGYKFASP
jgi:hypothetical protein